MYLQVFTCHRCGEAFESLEEMQTHKLTHDTVLNSLKDNSSIPPSQNAIAKFALGQQKNEQGMNKYDTIKPEIVEDTKPSGVVLKVPNNNGFYIPANLDNVSALSNKLIMEGMEKMAKEAAELEVQKKYQEELKQLNADARKYQEYLDQQKRLEDEERAKIAECFTIKAAAPSPSSEHLQVNESANQNMQSLAGKETTTVVNGDGMSMFILPTSHQYSHGEVEKSESEMEADDTESEQNSSKDSVGINREGDDERSEGEVSDRMDCSGEAGEQSGDDSAAKEDEISKSDSSKMQGYSKPCPKSKKPGYVPPITQCTETKTISSDEYQGIAPKPMLSLLNPRLNELIKAKVEHNMSQSQNQTTLIVTPTINQQLPKLTFIPNIAGNKYSPMANLSTILPAPSLSSIAFTSCSTQPVQQIPLKSKSDTARLIKCEHCCIYFEDNAMSMLHNTLHSADNADPFTCRKCYKKLGNRLEFMAHMVWHLEPNMDI